jgi:uncharacterized protein YndB with AHSA1/START domain
VRFEGGGAVEIDVSTIVGRPVATVWDFYAVHHVENHPRWDPDLELEKLSDGPIRLGTLYADSSRMGTFRGEVAELDPSSRVEFRETLRWPGGAKADARMDYVLEANHGGTVVHHVAQTELTGWMRLMRPVARLMVRSERKRTLRSLSRSFG